MLDATATTGRCVRMGEHAEAGPPPLTFDVSSRPPASLSLSLYVETPELVT